MRFCDLFVEYKIMLDSLSKRKPWKSLPLTHKMVTMIFIFLYLLMLLFLILQIEYLAAIIGMLIAGAVLGMFGFSWRKKDVEKRLNEIYKPYAKKRRSALVQLLRRYNIDPSDENCLKQLLDLAEDEKKRNHPPLSRIKPLVYISSFFSTVFLYLVKAMIDQASQLELIEMGVFFLAGFAVVSGLIYAVIQIFEWILPGNKMLYEDFKIDIKQLIVFRLEKE